VSRPAGTRAPGHGFPQTGDAFREAIEGRAESDVVDEGEGLALVAYAPLTGTPESMLAPALERQGIEGHGATSLKIFPHSLNPPHARPGLGMKRR
jgi:hypothetical protein